MGQDQSLPPLAEDQLYINSGYAKLEKLDHYIPEDHSIESISLVGNKIRQFPSTLHKLTFLDLSNNELNEVDFSQINFNFESLQIIRLSSNQFKEIPKQIFEFKSLESIALDTNQIEDENYSFTSFDKLANLDLFLNGFREVPPLPESLKQLNIGFNHIRSISFHAANLTELQLAGNDMAEFSTECFFPELINLDISMNRLVELPPITSFAPKLSSLNCAYNFIVGLTSIPTTIQSIDISHNCVELISFDGLENLTNLDISFNKIKILPQLPQSIEHFNAEFNLIEQSESCQQLTKLNSLQINSNHLTEIPDFRSSTFGIFIMKNNFLKGINVEHLCDSIKRIDLTGNEIEVLPEALFDLPRVQVLNLSFNKIKEIPPSISKLTINTLFINGNPISSLPELPSTLMTLCASSCNFTTIPESIKNIPRLSSLDLSNNQITALTEFPNIYHLNLSLNSIEQLPPVPENMSSLDLSDNQIKAFEIRGDFVMIQEINLSNNNLTMYQIACDNLPVLNSLKISNNPKLKMNLQFEQIPVINVLDISGTQIKVQLPLPNTLKDFTISDQQLYKSINKPLCRLFNSLDAGYSEICGTRKSMEDAIIVRKNVVPSIDMYAVIDGHGGTETPVLSAFYIPELFQQSKNKSIGEMSNVFRRINKTLQEHKVRDGATIALTLVTPTEIGIAHLGDARALIVRKDKSVVTLTYDHKPTERSEIDLLKENHSYISSNRTAGILAVSRSLGDFRIPGVVRVPDLSCYKRHPDDYRLILGCDGVFDVMNNAMVGETALNCEDVNKAACLIRNLAFSRGSQDNISVIVVDISMKQ